jgi:CO/xanthine dehydrogenase FAD-binding subunit
VEQSKKFKYKERGKLKIKEFIRPDSLQQANELLSSEGAFIVGGGAFMHLGDIEIKKAIDLHNLGLDYIVDGSEQIEIGAMTSLRELEISSVIKQNFNGILSKAAASIMGVQVRNIATIGGSIYGKYGFSDILTVMLALNAQVELYNAGLMSLENYLDSTLDKDIVLKVVINKSVSKASFECFRKTCTDFSVLNAAAALVKGKLRICVGARPGRAKVAKGAMSFLNIIDSSNTAAEMAGILAAEELQFGSDLRASEEYRKELCHALVKRCVLEVLQ